MAELLRPARGGFLRPFGCGWFIKEFLSGNAPYGSPKIDPGTGAPQAYIFYCYKHALIRETAMDRAVKVEERKAKKEKRPINPDKIDELFQKYLARLPYKAQGSRYHSFVTYFSTIQRLNWVEPSGIREASAFQDNYPKGNPRIYYRLTNTGRQAPEQAWADPHKALYS